MALRADFQFTQSNLQDFLDCPSRFWLKYVLRQGWPALEAEPYLENEQRMVLGTRFHRLAQQRLVGIPGERLRRMVEDGDLQRWWENFLALEKEHNPQAGSLLHGRKLVELNRQAEVTLTAQVDGFRLTAKFDALATAKTDEGLRLYIYDWKTSARRPKRTNLAQRIQTRLYPFLLVEAGSSWNDGRAVTPGQVEMIYWFSEEPTQPERFPYDTAQYQDDRALLLETIRRIDATPEQEFSLTPNEKHCKYCVYRSYCNRGVQAPFLEVGDEAGGLDEPEGSREINFDQIGEIVF